MKPFVAFEEYRLIGLAGTFASGKDTAASYLEQKGFMHLSTGDVLRVEATRQGRDHQRATLIEIAVEIRKQYGGAGALVERGIEQWFQERDTFKAGLVVSGLRTVGESEELQNQNGLLAFIDAPVEVRYKRAVQRAKEGSRTIELDNVHSLDDFIGSERVELEGLGGPDRPYLRGIERIADTVIQNVGTKQEFLRAIDRLISMKH